MKVLKSRELTPGMITARPVYNLQGILLLNRGVELSEKNIWILRSWGVNEVWIEGGKEEEEKKEKDPENQLTDLVDNKIKEKFAGVPDNQVMMEIMRLSRKHLEKRLISDARRKAPA
ncbi:MAG: hypothetical protein JXA35_07970 [Deltaproteobacteria bacterium]|nr:hypothetical protein [Deltaproteobacteria bacterium]